MVATYLSQRSVETPVFQKAVATALNRYKDRARNFAKLASKKLPEEDGCNHTNCQIDFFNCPAVLDVLRPRVRELFGLISSQQPTEEQIKTLIARMIMVNMEKMEKGAKTPHAITPHKKALWKIRFPSGATFPSYLPVFGKLTFPFTLTLTYFFVSSPQFGLHRIGRRPRHRPRPAA